MIGGRVIVGETCIDAPGLDAARLQRRAALLARTGGGTLIAPTVGGERLLFPGVRHLPVPIVPGLSPDRRAAAVAEQLGELLEPLRPRLVHTLGLSTAIPAILRRRSGCAVIVEPGIPPSQWLRDHEPDLAAERLVDLAALEDKTLSRADAVVARSVVEAAALVRRGVASERIHTARDGLPTIRPHLDDSAEEEPGAVAEPAELSGMPHLLWLGDMEPWSGFQLPLDALARVRTPWRLTCVVPEDAPGGQIEAHARSLKVAERVTVSRDTSPENLAARLTAAQAVLCTLMSTRAVESGAVLPLAVLFALAAGRPLIAPDLPVVRAYAGRAAAYYGAGDPGGLAERATQVLGDATLRARLREDAQAAAASLDWEDTEQPIADLWSTL